MASDGSAGTESEEAKLTLLIGIKGDEIRQMKANKAAKETITPVVEALLQLKKEYERVTGKPFDPPKEGKETTKPPTPAASTKPADTKPPKESNKGKEAKESDSDGPPVGLEDLREVRVGKMKTMLAAGVNPFAYTYKTTHKTTELVAMATKLANGEEDEKSDVAVAGRIMLRRVFGKLAFFTLQDESGQIQLYLEKGRFPNLNLYFHSPFTCYKTFFCTMFVWLPKCTFHSCFTPTNKLPPYPLSYSILLTTPFPLLLPLTNYPTTLSLKKVAWEMLLRPSKSGPMGPISLAHEAH